jgi:leader peptidase (prepilin peptidase) / N-methyltransferase
MLYYTYFCLFVLGLLIGSFLNVVILRFNTGASIAKGRSKCFSCGKELSWYELVPLVSFISQGGACRECKARISWQYPAVELLCAVMFCAAYYKIPNAFGGSYAFSFFVVTCALSCLYLVMCVYDLRHKIIPDAFSYSAALLALVLIFIHFKATGTVDSYRLIAGPALFVFFWFFWFVSGGRWMGLGDGKLALSLGWAAGLWKGIAGLLFSFWIGAVITLLFMLIQRVFGSPGKLGLKSEIPFGPYILIGFAIAVFWGIDIQAVLGFLAV